MQAGNTLYAGAIEALDVLTTSDDHNCTHAHTGART
jgi:hypothetical protein